MMMMMICTKAIRALGYKQIIPLQQRRDILAQACRALTVFDVREQLHTMVSARQACMCDATILTQDIEWISNKKECDFDLYPITEDTYQRLLRDVCGYVPGELHEDKDIIRVLRPIKGDLQLVLDALACLSRHSDVCRCDLLNLQRRFNMRIFHTPAPLG